MNSFAWISGIISGVPVEEFVQDNGGRGAIRYYGKEGGDDLLIIYQSPKNTTLLKQHTGNGLMRPRGTIAREVLDAKHKSQTVELDGCNLVISRQIYK